MPFKIKGDVANDIRKNGGNLISQFTPNYFTAFKRPEEKKKP